MRSGTSQGEGRCSPATGAAAPAAVRVGSLESRQEKGGQEQGSPVCSPRISRDKTTVKMGAELFTVSAKETATFFRLTRPKTTVANLKMSRKWHHTSVHL